MLYKLRTPGGVFFYVFYVFAKAALLRYNKVVIVTGRWPGGTAGGQDA